MGGWVDGISDNIMSIACSQLYRMYDLLFVKFKKRSQLVDYLIQSTKI